MSKQSKHKPDSQPYNESLDWDAESKTRFLKYCKDFGRKPTQETAEYYLFGDSGSIEASEEPIPEWYWELP